MSKEDAMPLTPNEVFRLAQLEANARKEVWAKQASEEGLGTKLAIGAVSAGEKTLRALGGKKLMELIDTSEGRVFNVLRGFKGATSPEEWRANRDANFSVENLEAAMEGAGTAGKVGQLATDIGMLALPGTAAGKVVAGGIAKFLPRALMAKGAQKLVPELAPSALANIGGQAVAGGAIAGATTPGTASQRAEAAGYGALGGGLGEAGGQVLTKIANKAQALRTGAKEIKEGIPASIVPDPTGMSGEFGMRVPGFPAVPEATPGMLSPHGGLVNEIEEGLKNLPFIGKSIKEAQEKALEKLAKEGAFLTDAAGKPLYDLTSKGLADAIAAKIARPLLGLGAAGYAGYGEGGFDPVKAAAGLGAVYGISKIPARAFLVKALEAERAAVQGVATAGSLAATPAGRFIGRETGEPKQSGPEWQPRKNLTEAEAARLAQLEALDR